jgi:hypothetical protein
LKLGVLVVVAHSSAAAQAVFPEILEHILEEQSAWSLVVTSADVLD